MTHEQAAKYPFYGHDDGLVVSQPESGKFVERPMTPAELAAREPAHQIAQDIYRHANYAGVCYAELWDIIAKAMQKLLDERAADEPSSVAVNEPVFYRCETCKEIMLATHLVGADGHDRIEETSEGQPYQVPCGPVRPSILSAGEYINRFLPANWLKDSSLETWFPLVAEEIELLRQQRDELIAALRNALPVLEFEVETRGSNDLLYEIPAGPVLDAARAAIARAEGRSDG